MAYFAAYQHPGFSQSAPRGPEWERLGHVSQDGRAYSGAVIFRNRETGEERAAPSGIWYNLTPADYAKGLRYGADRQEECAAYKDGEGKPWSASDAERNRRQARRLRAMATLCDRSTELTAGAIDFRGLSNPLTPPDEEARVVAAIERGED